MREAVRKMFAVVSLLVLSALPAAAQTTTGRIGGTVTDTAGAPLPGVTVTIQSEAMMGTRSAVTGETGEYRFSGLPLGTYTVTAALPGFGERTAEAQVTVGALATADFTMAAEFSETMTVAAEAPLVDTTASGMGANYGKEFLEDLPTNRNYYDIMAVSPGVSLATEDSDRLVAFGANVQSNAWYIDGIETTAPETGTAWVSVNPDIIEEVQVMGIGAPAEYGGMMGAALNVVTKSGGNDFSGSAGLYWFDDDLVDSAIDLEGTDYPEYTQKEFWDVTATLGGPIKKDKLWFFGAYEYWRDGHAYPGSDPSTTPTWFSDRYDLKLNARLNPQHSFDAKGYYDEWGYPDPATAFVAPSARAGEVGTTTAWGLGYQGILSDRTLIEARYSGWESDDNYLSQTGSNEPAYIDYSPPGGGPTTYSGGVYWPWTYDTSTDQLSASVSHFADEFIQGSHDFKFGVQMSQGDAVTKVSPSATGTYYYHYTYNYYGYDYEYYYKVEGLPYFYGNEQDAIGVFADDSWSINDRLTLNVGLRWDRVEGKIPNFPRLDPFGNETGETIPGVDPVFTWNTVSPRIGIAYNAGAEHRTVIRGSFGVYYDGNVSGNWNAPAPFAPTLFASVASSPDGPYEPAWEWNVGPNNVDPDLDPPRTLQYSLGVERQVGANYAFGIQGVYKDTTNLIGWEILDDGVYEEISYTDPFTGKEYTLLDPVEFPTVRKGNQPGFTIDPDADEYWQEYWALMLTANRRFADRWSMSASYTYSESKGLIPRFLSQWQFNPFYSSNEGADPNSFLNSGDGFLLQGDRPHMFRVQANVELPWQLRASTSINLQSGRPYYRQAQLPTQGRPSAILETGNRHPFQELVDVAIGRSFRLGSDVEMKLDLQVFNLLNDDATDWFETVELAAGEDFVPTYYVKPRRMMLKVGFAF